MDKLTRIITNIIDSTNESIKLFPNEYNKDFFLGSISAYETILKIIEQEAVYD